jgi:hypothetical protein
MKIQNGLKMTEAFIHYIWKYKNFHLGNLTTTAGEPMEIIHTGEHNSDAGPDFFNARIRIGNTIWAGNIEIHVRASDWSRHEHQHDSVYDNIILHVVHEADQWIRDKSGKAFPTVELNGRITPEVYKKYLNFGTSKDWIPCGIQAGKASRIVVEAWLERLCVERLERKAESILETLQQNQNNWEETFYQYLARNFGFRVNAVPFNLLARSVPLHLASRYKDNLMLLEALFFGQAGLLEDFFFESYPQRLQSEYQFLAHKHSITGIDGHLWKFLRMRPMNFPTIRIAQFVNLIHKSEHLFSSVLEANELPQLKSLFASGVSAYWHTHYQFGSFSAPGLKMKGAETIENIIINTVVPFLFVYGKQKGIEEMEERALRLLEETKPENNSVASKWTKIGLRADNGARSQALLELKNRYCSERKCLECGIGRDLLKNS